MASSSELLPAVLFIVIFHCSPKLSSVVLLLLSSTWGTVGLPPHMQCHVPTAGPEFCVGLQSPVLNGGRMFSAGLWSWGSCGSPRRIVYILSDPSCAPPLPFSVLFTEAACADVELWGAQKATRRQWLTSQKPW